jgi:tetratricopeptide (TPR) repeat protein
LLRAHALANLGVAERELGDVQSAIEHLEAAVALKRAIRRERLLAEDLCELSVAYLGLGRLPQAQAVSAELLRLLGADREGMIDAQYMLWCAARTRRLEGDLAAARSLLVEAHGTLQRRASAIPDAESRASFLAIRHHRQIRAAYDRGEWPSAGRFLDARRGESTPSSHEEGTAHARST